MVLGSTIVAAVVATTTALVDAILESSRCCCASPSTSAGFVGSRRNWFSLGRTTKLPPNPAVHAIALSSLLCDLTLKRFD